jgi:hypothetical protein
MAIKKADISRLFNKKIVLKLFTRPIVNNNVLGALGISGSLFSWIRFAIKLISVAI